MRRLAAWSGRRVLGLGLAWFGLLVGLIALNFRGQWQRQVRAAELTRADSIARSTPDSAPAVVSNNKRLQASAEQHTDFVYSVVYDDVDLLKTGLLLFGPPGLLAVLWLHSRHRRQSEGGPNRRIG
jgi:hypothetical protein